MFNMERKFLLEGSNSKLSVAYDLDFGKCSIAICDGTEPNVKFISKELYDMLVKELENQEYI